MNILARILSHGFAIVVVTVVVTVVGFGLLRIVLATIPAHHITTTPTSMQTL